MIIIETKFKDLFEHWLKWLFPILEISDSERKLLAAFITLHYYYTKQKYNPDTLNELLFSDETKEGIRKKLEFSKIRFTKDYNRLLELKLIENNKLHHLLTRYPKDGKFKIDVEFKLI